MTKPSLTLIDTDTGEVVESHTPDELQTLNERLTAELNGYRLRLSNLQKEIRDLQGTEPEAEDIRFVLGYWGRRVVEEGWFSRRPTFKPGSERWSVVRARLKEDWTSDQLCLVVEGALAQPKARMKRAWLDATSIFRNERNCSQHFEHSQDPECLRVRAVAALPEELAQAIRSGEITMLLRRCECGHLRMAHTYPLQPLWAPDNMVGWTPCVADGCDCVDFDGLRAAA